MDIYLDPPQLKNTFENDPFLKKYLSKVIPAQYLPTITEHLKECGELAITRWLVLSQEAEQNPPSVVNGDIKVHPSWKALEAEASKHGIVAAAYERKFNEYSRVYQFALLYLYHSSSAFVSCPLAMTDGAARALELYGDENLKSRALPHLLSREPSEFWTSGQWMTERTGGSDISGTSTIAKKSGAGWSLTGTKWFTSATTSPMSMLLARPEGAPEGSRGLSLFYCELRDKAGKLQNIEVIRLKPKLGTNALPTAELNLHSTPALMVGDEGGGVKKISSLFNITRIYNSVCAISHMRRALDLAWDFSKKRSAFGKKLIDLPLHKANLLQLEDEFKKCFFITTFVAQLLGRDECNVGSESESILLRALTPIAKLYTAKVCLRVVSEVLESFGGAGYIEDTGIPRLLRDAQVFSIWEGTTNVLSLDFLRAAEKENALSVLLEFLERDLKPSASPIVKSKIESIFAEAKKFPTYSRDQLEIASRPFCLSVGELVGSAMAEKF